MNNGDINKPQGQKFDFSTANLKQQFLYLNCKLKELDKRSNYTISSYFDQTVNKMRMYKPNIYGLLLYRTRVAYDCKRILFEKAELEANDPVKLEHGKYFFASKEQKNDNLIKEMDNIDANENFIFISKDEWWWVLTYFSDKGIFSDENFSTENNFKALLLFIKKMVWQNMNKCAFNANREIMYNGFNNINDIFQNMDPETKLKTQSDALSAIRKTFDDFFNPDGKYYFFISAAMKNKFIRGKFTQLSNRKTNFARDVNAPEKFEDICDLIGAKIVVNGNKISVEYDDDVLQKRMDKVKQDFSEKNNNGNKLDNNINSNNNVIYNMNNDPKTKVNYDKMQKQNDNNIEITIDNNNVNEGLLDSLINEKNEKNDDDYLNNQEETSQQFQQSDMMNNKNKDEINNSSNFADNQLNNYGNYNNDLNDFNNSFKRSGSYSDNKNENEMNMNGNTAYKKRSEISPLKVFLLVGIAIALLASLVFGLNIMLTFVAAVTNPLSIVLTLFMATLFIGLTIYAQKTKTIRLQKLCRWKKSNSEPFLNIYRSIQNDMSKQNNNDKNSKDDIENGLE